MKTKGVVVFLIGMIAFTGCGAETTVSSEKDYSLEKASAIETGDACERNVDKGYDDRLDAVLEYYHDFYASSEQDYRTFASYEEKGNVCSGSVAEDELILKLGSGEYHISEDHFSDREEWFCGEYFEDEEDNRIVFFSLAPQEDEGEPISGKRAVKISPDGTIDVIEYDDGEGSIWAFGETKKFGSFYFESVNEKCGIFYPDGTYSDLDHERDVINEILENEFFPLDPAYRSTVSDGVELPFYLGEVYPIWIIDDSVVYRGHVQNANWDVEPEQGYDVFLLLSDGKYSYGIINVENGEILLNGVITRAETSPLQAEAEAEKSVSIALPEQNDIPDEIAEIFNSDKQFNYFYMDEVISEDGYLGMTLRYNESLPVSIGDFVYGMHADEQEDGTSRLEEINPSWYRYAVADLDGDGAGELICSLGTGYFDFLILFHISDGEVDAYPVYARDFDTIYQDGTIATGNGSFYGYKRITLFEQNGFEETGLALATILNSTDYTYSIGSEEATRAEFDAYTGKWNEEFEVEWVDFE